MDGIDLATELLPSFLAVGVLSGVALAVGKRQHAEGRGTRLRLFLVASAVGLLASLPVFLWNGLVLAKLGWNVEPTVAFSTAALAFFLGFLGFLAPPGLPLDGKSPSFPVATDRDLLARVAALAKTLGLAPPVVRLAPTVLRDVQAYAGGLPAPSLVLADGAVTRLEPKELDAIVAHELGHVATGSLWFLPLVGVLAAVGATIASARVHWSVAYGLFLALLVGLRRVVGWPTELACDAAGQRCVGSQDTLRALEKLHAAHRIKGERLATRLARAVATHPPRSIRIAAIARRASPEERERIAVDASALRGDRLVSVLACALWLSSVGASVALGTKGAPHVVSWAIAGGLGALCLAPYVLLRRALGRQIRREQARLGVARARRWPAFFVLAGLGLVVAALVQTGDLPGGRVDPSPEQIYRIFACFVGGIGALILGSALNMKKAERELLKQVGQTLQRREFAAARKLLEQKPAVVASSLLLRFLQGYVLELSRDHAAALATLEALAAEKKHFPAATLLLGKLLRRDDPTRSLALARELEASLPGDPVGPYAVARAARQLGDRATAEAALERGLALEPEDGGLLALAAELAQDRGETERARELIARALEHSPGEVPALLARARLSIETGPREQAAADVEAAAKGVASDPFALLEGELDELRARLAPPA